MENAKGQPVGTAPLENGVLWIVLAIAGGVAFFWDGINSLFDAWSRPEYSHGPLIPIIAGFLLTAVQTWTGRPSLSGKPLAVLVAIWLAHAGQIATIGKTGGWALELQGMFLFGAIAVAFLGAGRFSLGGTMGRYN